MTQKANITQTLRDWLFYLGGIVPVFLGVAFSVFKLFGAISWSWIWVLSPFWIALILWDIIIVAITWSVFSVSKGTGKKGGGE